MATLNDTNKAYLTPNEVAQLLMVAPMTVRSWAQKGLLVAKVTPGGHRRFLKSDVERFVRESGAAQADVKSCATRVLIVDDDSLMTTYIYDILVDSGLGYVIGTAQNSFEGGVKIHTFAPDVVLLNFMLPDIDAFRISSLIKGDASTGHICVIAIAGDLSAGNVSRMLKAGADTFLAKPFKPQDLLGLLSQTASARKNLPGARIGTTSEPRQFVKESDDAETLLFSLKRIAEAKNNYIGHHDATRLANWVDIFAHSLVSVRKSCRRCAMPVSCTTSAIWVFPIAFC